MTNVKRLCDNIANAFKLVLGFNGEIRQQVNNRPPYHQIGQVVSFAITNLMEPIAAIIHQRHENRKGYRYDIIVHYPIDDCWMETRLYNVDEVFLDANIVIKEYDKEVKQVTNVIEHTLYGDRIPRAPAD